MVNQFDVYLVALNPTLGVEIQKTRPCLVVSPNEMNHTLKTVIVAPMTSNQRAFPSRIKTVFQSKKGDVALDQIRAVDKTRLVKHLGIIDDKTSDKVLERLQEIFS